MIGDVTAKMSSQDLQRFLEEKAEPGRFDSQGHFSLSVTDALEKLKEHAVADPAHWILKLVQAGVAGRADEIAIKTFRRATRADLILATLPPLDQLEGALLRLEASRGSLLGELCVGLRALLNLHKFRLLWCDGKRAQGVAWNGRSLDQVQPHACSVSSPRLRLEFSGPQVSAAARADEALLLEQRCRWCGVTLMLDGRQVNGPGNLPRSQFSSLRHGSGSPRYLASGWLGVPLSEMAKPESISRAITTGRGVLQTEPTFIHWARQQGHQFEGGFCFFVSYEYVSGVLKDLLRLPGHHHSPFLISEFFRLGVSRLGVLCGGYESDDFGLGGELVISGDSLPTDLVGLSVEPDSRWLQEMSRMLEELTSLVDIVEERLVAHGRRAKSGRWQRVRERVVAVLELRRARLATDVDSEAGSKNVPRSYHDNPRVLEKLPEWLAENYGRLRRSPPPRYWRRLNLPMGGV